MLGQGRTLQAGSRNVGVKAPMLSQRPVRAIVPSACRQMRGMRVTAMAGFSPPTVAETKLRFLKNYNKPIMAIYNNVVQELLVQQHFMRYSKNYEYNEWWAAIISNIDEQIPYWVQLGLQRFDGYVASVAFTSSKWQRGLEWLRPTRSQIFALGFVSVFDQILESLDSEAKSAIFSAYLKALDENPEQYRKDAQQLEELATKLSGPADLTPDANGSALQKALAKVQERTAAGQFAYNKFTAIGLFRLLELTGAKEPAALERLVKAVGVSQDAVNRDLVLYKGILSKLSAAKEMLKEFLEREKRKQGEREAEKAAKAAGKTTEKPAGVQA